MLELKKFELMLQFYVVIKGNNKSDMCMYHINIGNYVDKLT